MRHIPANRLGSRAAILAVILTLVAGPSVSEAVPPPLVAIGTAEGLILTLVVRQRRVRWRTPVVADLELMNTRTSPITLMVAPLQVFDLVVRNTRGEKVWAWTNRALPLVPPGRVTVQPGERYRGEVIWDGTAHAIPGTVAKRAPTGTYRVEGALHAPVLEVPALRLRTARLTVTVSP